MGLYVVPHQCLPVFRKCRLARVQYISRRHGLPPTLMLLTDMLCLPVFSKWRLARVQYISRHYGLPPTLMLLTDMLVCGATSVPAGV
ncbi:hypothetical protein J6590_032006 [Homalodisca vitripennis]|nr:hypothetical protein J6590_032006 [Homalodisca vitripennis]